MKIEKKDNEPKEPIYKFEFDPDTNKIVRTEITEYTTYWNGKRVQYKDGLSYKRIFKRDFEGFSYGRIFSRKRSIENPRNIAKKGLLKRIENYERMIERIRNYLRAFEEFEEVDE